MKLSQFMVLDLATNSNMIEEKEVRELMEAASKDKNVNNLEVRSKSWDNGVAIKIFQQPCYNI